MSIELFNGDHAFLSNFYQCPVRYEGALYPSVEHAFQAAKTLDVTERTKIAKAPTASDAKRLGRTVRLRSDWESVKAGVMQDCLMSKFTRELGDKLLATGDAELIEGNTWHDNVWGDCRCGRPACKAPGKNMLGALLMSVRASLGAGWFSPITTHSPTDRSAIATR